ncbi:MAG: AI-2E family transporter, partial [Chloroflexi bacterium]|nr:AI-2E family transporter [Chloroflexota bacterium]
MAQRVATTDAQERAAAAWRALGGRLRTVTPSGIGRMVVVIATIVGAVWLLGVTWPAIVPFLAGGVLAYAVLPVVDRLDRFMPRVLAGLLAVAGVVAAVIAFLAIVGPPVVAQLVKIFLELPTGERLADVGLRVREWLATLPEGSQAIATEVIDRVVAILRADISGALDGLAAFIADSIVHAFDAASVLLGLLVIPTWILAVTNDSPDARRRLARHVAPWLRPDLLALARLTDAVASAFLRVQILASAGTGFGVWLALYALGRAGVVPEAPYIAVAAIAGAA